MKVFRLLIISIVLLFSIVTGMSLLIPSEVRISRATNMHALPATVWAYVDDMRQWQQWNPFVVHTADSLVRYTGAGSNHVDAGIDIDGTSIRWVEMKKEERIARMSKKDFKPVIMGWRIINHTATDSITVQWYMNFRLRWYPWEKFSSLLFEKNYGTRMEQGLTRLKKLAEGDR